MKANGARGNSISYLQIKKLDASSVKQEHLEKFPEELISIGSFTEGTFVL